MQLAALYCTLVRNGVSEYGSNYYNLGVVAIVNHQTHHRGQAHALLTAIVGNDKTPSFDLIVYQRQTGIGLRTSG